MGPPPSPPRLPDHVPPLPLLRARAAVHKFCRFRDAASVLAALNRAEIMVAGEPAVMRPAYQRGPSGMGGRGMGGGLGMGSMGGGMGSPVGGGYGGMGSPGSRDAPGGPSQCGSPNSRPSVSARQRSATGLARGGHPPPSTSFVNTAI